ncbi:hypothetical protein NE237_005537 [Protea cynaroides]|uniref:Uncharacterized protein n=1 Tax=Protea cynaroides TaxID=273540 RepID=A0A9Q0JRY9_9MAGN|nr:hypothetical protein NE237_005537 [Protea cynaroides]
MVEDEDKDISDTVNSLQKSNSSLTVNCCIGSGTCSIGCNHINCFKSFGWRCWRKQSPSPEAYMMNYTALEDDVVKSNEEFKESSKNTAIMKRKHSRPFSWQRRRKRRQLTS